MEWHLVGDKGGDKLGTHVEAIVGGGVPETSQLRGRKDSLKQDCDKPLGEVSHQALNGWRSE